MDGDFLTLAMLITYCSELEKNRKHYILQI